MVPRTVATSNNSRSRPPQAFLEATASALASCLLLLHYLRGRVYVAREKLSLATWFSCVLWEIHFFDLHLHLPLPPLDHQPWMNPYMFIYVIWLSPHDHLPAAFEWKNAGRQWKLDGSISWDSDWLLPDYFAPVLYTSVGHQCPTFIATVPKSRTVVDALKFIPSVPKARTVYGRCIELHLHWSIMPIY